ncbi:MAG TPA: tetratricopeptide repeat protein, partial [Methylomirabilota bacterium]|nr:tetratricopeptide repeat protein [Methylomirabilota bacterium]
ERSLHALEAAYGTADLRVADVATELAEVLVVEGRTIEAIGLFRRSLAIAEAGRSSADPLSIATLDGLGRALQVNGDLEAAEGILRRALDAWKLRGADDLALTGPQIALGTVCRDRRKSDEAESLLLTAIATRERRLSPSDPAIASAVQELATLYRGEWRLAEAERLYLRTLEIRERALGSDHADVAETLLNLERTYLSLGNNGEADRVHRRAAAIATV